MSTMTYRDDDDYDPMIKWVIEEVIQAITNTEPSVYSDEQWLSLYDTLQDDIDCAEEAYREYQSICQGEALAQQEDAYYD
jgi:hypothetical protein